MESFQPSFGPASHYTRSAANEQLSYNQESQIADCNLFSQNYPPQIADYTQECSSTCSESKIVDYIPFVPVARSTASSILADNENKRPCSARFKSLENVNNYAVGMNLREEDFEPVSVFPNKNSEGLSIVLRSGFRYARKGKDKLYKCSICLFQTSALNGLNNHKKSHSVVKYHCSYSSNCSFKSAFKNNVKQHEKAHKQRGELYSCSTCPYTTLSEDDYQKHIKCHYKESTGTTYYLCFKCTFRTSRKAQLVQHERSHTLHQDKPFACSKCSFRTVGEGLLKAHMNSCFDKISKVDH